MNKRKRARASSWSTLYPMSDRFRNGRMVRPKTEAGMAKTASLKNVPTHDVYVVDGEGDHAFWSRIGAAWPHKDGAGYNIHLTAVPLAGRVVLRIKKEARA